MALDYLNKVTKRRAIVFLISDFVSPDFTKTISITNKKHDLIAITLTDPREKEIPASGYIFLEDAETGEELIIESTNPLFQQNFKQLTEKEFVSRKRFFQSINLDDIEITTDESYVKPLIAFFRMRERRYR